MNKLKSSNSLEQMIRQQIIERGISDPRIVDAMRRTPRDQFFPRKDRSGAYSDKASMAGQGHR